MILRPEPVAAALAEIRRPSSTVILLDAAGEPFRHARAQALSEGTHLVLLCPRYEGVDERIRAMVDLELSIGDYVLTGGELAALVVIDAVIRLLPGRSTPRRPPRSRTPRACSSTPSSPGRRRSRATTSRRCSRPAITPRSAGGGSARRCGARSSAGPTCSSTVPRPPGSCGSSMSWQPSGTKGRDGRSPRTSCYTPARRRQSPRPSTRLEKRSVLRRTSRRDRRVNVLDEIVSDQLRTDLPVLASGDTVRV